jgi:hypothetical protein
MKVSSEAFFRFIINHLKTHVFRSRWYNQQNQEDKNQSQGFNFLFQLKKQISLGRNALGNTKIA